MGEYSVEFRVNIKAKNKKDAYDKGSSAVIYAIFPLLHTVMVNKVYGEDFYSPMVDCEIKKRRK